MRLIHQIFLVLPIIFSAIILFAQQITPPKDSLKPKIFVIGFSKTGTTSIGDALTLLGYRRLGWRDIRSRHMVHTWAHGNYDPLIHLTRYHDAFEDLPWPLMYEELARRFPDAKFVLSLRKDEDTWMRSMHTHMDRGRWPAYRYFYGADTFQGNEETVRLSYRNHTRNVREFFRDRPDRYVELVIDDGDGNWEVLCRVAQCGSQGRVPSIGFPKSNTVASHQKAWVTDYVHWIWGCTLARVERLMVFYYYHQQASRLVNSILSSIWWVVDVIEPAIVEVYFRMHFAKTPPLAFDRVPQSGSI